MSNFRRPQKAYMLSILSFALPSRNSELLNSLYRLAKELEKAQHFLHRSPSSNATSSPPPPPFDDDAPFMVPTTSETDNNPTPPTIMPVPVKIQTRLQNGGRIPKYINEFARDKVVKKVWNNGAARSGEEYSRAEVLNFFQGFDG
jgi:hypothetical protein